MLNDMVSWAVAGAESGERSMVRERIGARTVASKISQVLQVY